MTDKVVEVKYGTFQMLMKITREEFEEMTKTFQDGILENLNKLGEKRCLKLCLKEGKYLEKQKGIEKDDKVLTTNCYIIYSLMTFGIEKAIVSFIDEDYETFKTQWISERYVICHGCEKEERIKSCALCKLKCYCSNECKLLNSLKHMKICRYLTKKDPA
jgi:hypothetical protein